MRGRGVAALAAAGALLATAACSAPDGPAARASGSSSASHAGSTRHLGAVPVPTAPSGDPEAVARPHRPALLAMGAPVVATLADGTRARLVALGPRQGTTRPGAPATTGTFRVVVAPRHGRLTLGARDFSSRDETGRPVRLRPSGPRTVTAAPGRPRTLVLAGRYGSGSAQLSYRHRRALVAVWDFTVELD